MTYDLAIFDLDGTLADSFPWFLRVVNGVADRFGFKRIEQDDVALLRGSGSRDILRLIDVPLWKLPQIATQMRRLKAQSIADIPLFPGVPRLFGELARHGVSIALVSSDSERNVKQQLGRCAEHVAHFHCGASLFGKAAKYKSALRQAGVEAQNAIAVGDEVRDLEAARAAGLRFGAVAWGYASLDALRERGPDEVFLTMDELIATLTAR